MRPSLLCAALAMFLLAFGLHSPGISQDSNVNESFEIAALNARLKNEAGLSPEQCREWLESRVLPMIACNGPQPAVKTQIEIEGVKVVSDWTRRGAVALRDKLHVVAPKEQQKRVKEMLDTFTRFGVRQIEIRTHVFRDTAEAMKLMPIQWSHVEAASSMAESPSSSAVVPASYQQPRTLTAKFIESQKPTSSEVRSQAEGVADATLTEATSIVERSTPVLYSLLSPTEHAAVMAHGKKQATLQRLMSPSVIVFNGQFAAMSNAVERPFVTGIKVMKLGAANKQQVEFAPHVKVYQEGTTMKVRPELIDGKSVRLNCQLDLCKIRSVETHAIPGIESRGEFNIQMPEVALTMFRTSLEMPIDYALAVSAFETDEAGVKHSVIVLCQCSLRDIETK